MQSRSVAPDLSEEFEEFHEFGGFGTSAPKHRRAAAPDALEHFAGPEHRDIGDLASGQEATTIAYGERGERLTFGEVVALAGDHFETYSEMVELARTAQGRAKIAWARWYALGLEQKSVPEPAADRKHVMDRYYILASRNWSHFSAGGEARQTYLKWHARAFPDALLAGQESNPGVWRRALTKEAFAAHFLTDMFSAGHVRIPRMAIRDWYARHVPEDQLLHYLVSYLNERLPRPLWARLPIASSVYSSIAQGRIEARLVEFGGAAVRVVSASDIVSVALHDLENRVGLRVVSDVDIDGRRVKGGFPWLALGDGQLHKSSAGSVTKRMATAAVITSLRDLERIRGVGRKLAGKRLSASQQADAVRQALGGMVSAALAFVPREDPTVRKDGANTPLPGQTPGKSPLDWRWGQLGDVTYHVVDEAIKNRIANEVASHLSTVDNSDQRRVLAEFVKHLRADGIRAIERAVGKKAR